jgi:hypothetical protein
MQIPGQFADLACLDWAFARVLLLQRRKPGFVEFGDHYAVANSAADETPTDPVLVSPKLESWVQRPARLKRTPQSQHIDDQQAEAPAVRLAIPALLCFLLPDIADYCRGLSRSWSICR